MNEMKQHSKKVEQLQNSIKAFRNQLQGSYPLALDYGKSQSNTIRTKTYKHHCSSLDIGDLNEVSELPSTKVKGF